MDAASQTAPKSTVLEPEWRFSAQPVPYPEALAAMEQRVARVEKGEAPELAWLLEHPSLYTAGTSASAGELLDAGDIPVFDTGRGGRYTYHGPGQRVLYAICDLRARGRDVRQHVYRLEEWMIRVLADFGIKGERREGRVGIWVAHDGVEEKIGAIGVRVRRWITYHGLALNVHPNLGHFAGIVPCGLSEFGVTSMHALGVGACLEDVDAAFVRQAETLIF